MAFAQRHLDAQAPVGGLGGAGDQVVDDAFGQAVDTLLGDSVRNQDNRQAEGGFRGADGSQQAVDVHARVEAGEGCVEQGQGQGTGFVEGSQRGLGGEDNLDVGAGGQQEGFESREEGGIGGSEQVSGRGLGEHPWTFLMDASAGIRKYLEIGGGFLGVFNYAEAGIWRGGNGAGVETVLIPASDPA